METNKTTNNSKGSQKARNGLLRGFRGKCLERLTWTKKKPGTPPEGSMRVWNSTLGSKVPELR